MSEDETKKKPARLHILKSKDNRYALELIEKQGPSNSITLLLIQDAVEMDLSGLKIPCFVLSGDLKSEQQSPHEKIAYAEMLRLIFKADTVMVW